jgi:hypothetical protein
MVAGSNLRWNRGPLHDERIAARQLKQEDRNIHGDNAASDDRHSHRPA